MATHSRHKKDKDPRVEAAFHEVKHNEPSVVAHTRRKFGAARAEAQKTAIALSKARKAGADIPQKAKRKVRHSPLMTEMDMHKIRTDKTVELITKRVNEE